MKHISITLILSLLMCVQSFSQDKLASLPEQQRGYRENVNPEVTKGKYVDIEKSRHIHNLPKDVKTGDIFYRVKLHYPNWFSEKFEYDYTAYVFILGKTLQPYFIHLGAVNIGYNLFSKDPRNSR